MRLAKKMNNILGEYLRKSHNIRDNGNEQASLSIKRGIDKQAFAVNLESNEMIKSDDKSRGPRRSLVAISMWLR